MRPQRAQPVGQGGRRKALGRFLQRQGAQPHAAKIRSVQRRRHLGGVHGAVAQDHRLRPIEIPRIGRPAQQRRFRMQPAERVKDQILLLASAPDQDHPRAVRGQACHRLHPRVGVQLHRQLEPEGRAFPGFRIKPHLATHQRHQPMGDGKAKPGAVVAAVRLVLHLVELSENMGLLVGGDADAGILHHDADRQALVIHRRGGGQNPDRHAALRGELHRVADQVGQHLPDPPAIADHPLGQEDVVVQPQLQVAPFDARLQQAENLSHGGVQVKAVLVQLQLARLDLREVQHVVDDHQQRLARIPDGVGI